MDQENITGGLPERGPGWKRLTFSTRAWLAVGLILAAPLLIGNAMTHYTTQYDVNGDIAHEVTETDYFIALVLFLLLTTTFITILLLKSEPSQMAPFLVMGLIFLLAVYLRAACLGAPVTNDYTRFLHEWVVKLRDSGGFAALGRLESDYNMPYLYILALISYLPVDDLLLIKFISIVADMVMAWVAMSLVREYGLSESKRLLVLAGVLFAPTIWLNSAYWAQCDVLYAVFALLCLRFALRGRPWLAVVMAGLGFAFKLQIIFFLPLLVVFLITKHIKWRHILAFPGVFLAISLPALALGRPFISLFQIYPQQVSQYSGFLNLNAPSAYAFLLQSANYPMFVAGIAAAGLFLVFLLYWLFLNKGKIDGNTLLTLALLLCTAIPWCLPSMHERYFFMADLFAVIYAVVRPKRFYVAPLMIYASYAGYHAYLFGSYLPFSMWVPSIFVALIAGFMFMDLREQLGVPTKPAPDVLGG